MPQPAPDFEKRERETPLPPFLPLLPPLQRKATLQHRRPPLRTPFPPSPPTDSTTKWCGKDAAHSSHRPFAKTPPPPKPARVRVVRRRRRRSVGLPRQNNRTFARGRREERGKEGGPTFSPLSKEEEEEEDEEGCGRGGSPERPSSPSPSHPSLRSYNNYFPFSSAVVCSNLPPISEQFSGAFEPPPPPPSFLERAGARRRGSLRRGIAGREGGGEGRAVGKTAGAPKTSSSLLLSLLYLFCALFKAFRIRQFSAHPHLSFIPKPKCTKQWRQTFQSLIATYLRPAADCCSRKQDRGQSRRRRRKEAP